MFSLGRITTKDHNSDDISGIIAILCAILFIIIVSLN